MGNLITHYPLIKFLQKTVFTTILSALKTVLWAPLKTRLDF